ncbi:hypothetical protein PsAD13_01082 [Pseudovibrio sp. Ad13]|nr:hypothetical protein PsAD13_01082 [Pseudovibrio sp. Ad13]
MRHLFILFSLLILISGCQSTCDGSKECFDKRIATSKKTMEVYAYKDTLSGTTTQSWSKKYGTLLEYLGENGRSYLVYPEKTHVIQGRWQVIQTGRNAEICFNYIPSNKNSTIPKIDKNWNCHVALRYIGGLNEIREGDLLRLKRTNKLPQTLPSKVYVSIETAMKEVGYTAKLTRNKACTKKNKGCRP